MNVVVWCGGCVDGFFIRVQKSNPSWRFCQNQTTKQPNQPTQINPTKTNQNQPTQTTQINIDMGNQPSGSVGLVGSVSSVGSVGWAGKPSMHASWRQVLDQWEAGYGPLLPVDQPFIWRCTPVDTKLTLKYAHQIVPESRLSNYADPSKFQAYFQNHLTNSSGGAVGAVGAVAFPSLSGTMLVAPLPVYLGRKVKNYAHLQLFLINASQAEHHAFWRKVAQTIRWLLNRLDKHNKQNNHNNQNKQNNNLVWTSVHNLSVNWLHVRVSTNPTYYNDSWCRHPIH